MCFILIVLLFCGSLYSMENNVERKDVIICIAEQPQETVNSAYFVRQNDMQHWMTSEMLRRDRDLTEAIGGLKQKMEELEKKIPMVNTRTKLAMAGTVLISVCSTVSAIITFFAEKNTTGSD